MCLEREQLEAEIVVAGGTSGAAAVDSVAVAAAAIRSQKSSCRCFHGDCSIILNYEQKKTVILRGLSRADTPFKYKVLKPKDDAQLLIWKSADELTCSSCASTLFSPDVGKKGKRTAAQIFSVCSLLPFQMHRIWSFLAQDPKDGLWW